MPLHPDLASFLELVELGRASGRQRAMHELSVDEARLAFARSSAMLESDPADLPWVRDLAVPAADGRSVAVRLYAVAAPSAAAPLPVLLYFHGGGYVVGDLDSHDALCRALARLSEWAVLAVDYRRAPEHRFPAAFDDALAVVRWLAAEGAGIGLDPGRLAVAGDSAGGTLATVLASLAVREPAAMPLPPRAQVLLYPVTDAVGDHPSRRRFAEGHLLESATLEWFFRHVERRPEDRSDWRLSPLRAVPPAGIAPALVLVGEYDPLVDETVAYAHALRQAGNDVTLRVLPGLTHDVLRMADLLPEAASLRRDIAAWLRSTA
ncbi:alpha/beta hydrolase [Azospirillum sp. ST 5-10]|uniref:alpha/beta hydrolase n=1 Tax=unclassified Azospirillum TaxID=2630922 RepID=UPI003F49DF50